MAETRPGMRAIPAPAARWEIKDILLRSEEKFGKDAALRNEPLLIQAVLDIEADPTRPGMRPFSLLLGIPKQACSGVFIGKTPMSSLPLSYTYRENALANGPTFRPMSPLYHLAFSRSRIAGVTVKEPRHFLVFRIRAPRLEIVRVLHDNRDLARHLLVTPGSHE